MNKTIIEHHNFIECFTKKNKKNPGINIKVQGLIK